MPLSVFLSNEGCIIEGFCLSEPVPSKANLFGLVTVVIDEGVVELCSELFAPPEFDAFECIEAAAADDVDEEDEPAANVELVGDLIDEDLPPVSKPAAFTLLLLDDEAAA